MLIGVMIQILFPCAPPWYELREGLTPANYGMRGSPAGLARIDALFHSHGYTLTFTGAPMVFGAFPSLHAGNATMKALFCSYFFPVVIKVGRLRIDLRITYWLYCFWLVSSSADQLPPPSLRTDFLPSFNLQKLYFSTMYLMHHYLIDLVAGACLATFCFYFFLTDELREAMEQHYPYRNSAPAPTSAAPPSNRPDQAFASTATANGGSIALDTLRGGAPYISGQGGVHGDEESQKKPEVIFSIDDGDADEDRSKEVAAKLARTKSPLQRVRSPAVDRSRDDADGEEEGLRR